MSITRNPDGTLIVPVLAERQHRGDEDSGDPSVEDDGSTIPETPTTRLLHPGEGGYDEALSQWDLEQNPDRQPAVSTATGREEAMTLVHEVAASPKGEVVPALESINDPEASGEALRHVLVGGVHSVEDFATEVAASHGGEPLSAHETTKIIGAVLTELD
jgi:hypothetical protein